MFEILEHLPYFDLLNELRTREIQALNRLYMKVSTLYLIQIICVLIILYYRHVHTSKFTYVFVYGIN